jgi:diadenylate cyclase
MTINASSEGIDLPLGVGSRHMAAASITHETNAMAVVVSETSTIRVFDDGEIISEVIPEVWLLRSYGLHLINPTKRASRTTILIYSALFENQSF